MSDDATVILVVSIGYPGAQQEHDTGMSRKAWDALSEDARNEIHNEAVWKYAETWVKK